MKLLHQGKKMLIHSHPMARTCFIILFLIIVILRTWKVPEFFSFNFDEEYQASLAWEQVKDFHPIWIGVSASNVGYYLGPGITYLNAALFAISQGDPVSLAWFSTFFGLVTTLSVFIVTTDLFGKRAGFTAMALYGGSAFIQFFDRRFWNPSPIPFISLWMVYSLIKGKKDPRWYILSALLVGISLHVHLSLVLLFPLVLISIVTNVKKINLKTWVGMASSYLLATLPLLIFDIVHNFDNLLVPFRFIANGGGGEQSLSMQSIATHIQVFFSSLGRIWYLQSPTNLQNEHCLGTHCTITPAMPALILLSVILLALFLWKTAHMRTPAYQHITYVLLIFPLSFFFYSGYSVEYYLLGFFILFIVAVSSFISRMPRMILIIVLSFFLLANAYTVFSSDQAQYGLITRKALIQDIIEEVGEKPFALETYGRDEKKYHPYGGWRYLFKIYGKLPVRSFADEFFGWIYADEISSVQPLYRVVISDDIPYKTENTPIQTFHQGAYYAYIFPVINK